MPKNIDLVIPVHIFSLEFPSLEKVRGIDFYGNLSEYMLSPTFAVCPYTNKH
jgi:hypothetical protein